MKIRRAREATKKIVMWLPLGSEKIGMGKALLFCIMSHVELFDSLLVCVTLVLKENINIKKESK